MAGSGLRRGGGGASLGGSIQLGAEVPSESGQAEVSCRVVPSARGLYGLLAGGVTDRSGASGGGRVPPASRASVTGGIRRGRRGEPDGEAAARIPRLPLVLGKGLCRDFIKM
eukprot:scaffold82372_cov31-Tisochrysis_lutea.AAC.3